MTFENLKANIARLREIKPVAGFDYYQLGLYADLENKFHYSLYSHWGGFTDEKPMREIREPSLIIPEYVIQLLKDINQPASIINNADDLAFFLWVIGGEAIIEKTIAETYLQHVLVPTVTAYMFSKGFVDINSIPIVKLNRAADPKTRMKILNRDNRRCKICGASPSTNEHVELHLHHIIPYSDGGITDEKNLVTLCHTCHKGLEPQIDYSLFDNIGVRMLEDSINEIKYDERIKRNVTANALRKKRIKKELRLE